MRRISNLLKGLVLVGLAAIALIICLLASPIQAQSGLTLSYPPNNHKTTADRIFLIGTAPATTEVRVNGQRVGDRSPAGHFAPSIPLQVGENTLVIKAGDQSLNLQIERLQSQSELPTGLAFGKDSLTPIVNTSWLPNEPVCLQAIAAPQAQVSAQLGATSLALQPLSQANLPANAAALTGHNQPAADKSTRVFKSCTAIATPGNLGHPRYQLSLNGQTLAQTAPGQITILNPAQFSIVEVTQALGGTARTGPSTDYSRLTPLPLGTRARVTAQAGDWLRLDYGGWIRQAETRSLAINVPVESIIRSLGSRQLPGWTEVRFPLEMPVPLMVDQGEQTFTLTLYNTTAQTDLIRLDDDPVIQRLDWQQVAPGQVQYRFNLKSRQQWGYKLRYEGATLVLSLRHPPVLSSQKLPLQGMTILLDPGHGGPVDSGSVGPTGYPEKSATLLVGKLLEQELRQRGAQVVMTRTEDVDLDLPPRVALINQTEPVIALSLHFNALPDSGDALKTKGIGAFWYQGQSHDLALFLQNYLVTRLNRPSYGLFWDNLALTRPAVAPAILLELGFMINPQEFEWIADPKAQQELANTLADGITDWFRVSSSRK